MLNLKTVLALVCGGMVLISSPLANTSHAAEEVTSSTVNVTATRSTKDLMDVGYSVDVITQEEIEKTAATSLADFLKNIPGIIISKASGATRDRISIRGEGDSGTLVLIDGVKISAAFHGHGADLVVDPSNIERIEVIKGPATVLYGAEALGGVINIITKKGGDKPLGADFRTAYNGESNAFVNSFSAYGTKDDFDYRITGAYTNRQDTLEFHSREDDNESSRYDLSSYLAYNFTDKIQAGVTYEYVNDDYQRGEYSSIDHYFYQTDRYTGFFQWQNISPLVEKIRVDAYHYDNHTEGPSGYATGIPRDFDQTDVGTSGFTLQSDFGIGDHTYIVAGYDFLHETYDRSDRTILTGADAVRDAEQSTHAIYAAVEHYLPSNFQLGYGIRYVNFNTGIESHVGSTGTIINTAEDGSTSRPVFNANVVWRGIDNLALRAAWAQGYRPASFYHKYLDIPMGHSGFVGNPDLEAEESNNFEIGARYSAYNLTADLTTYYNHTKNRISTESTPSGASKWINHYKTNTYGVELSLAYALGFGLEPYIVGAWMHREAENPDGSAINHLSPELTGIIGVRYSQAVANEAVLFNADIYAEYTSAIDGYSASSTRHYADNPSRTLLNAAFGAKFGEAKDYYVEAQFNNILDEKYKQDGSYSYYQPGFNMDFVFGVRF